MSRFGNSMEQKAEADIAAAKIERARVELCYRSWLDQIGYRHVEDIQAAFKAGYAQGKYDERSQGKEGEAK